MNTRLIAQQLFLLWPVRALARLSIGCLALASRIIGNAKLMALAPHAKGTVCHWSVELKSPENITFGKNVVIGPGCTIGAHARIVLADHVRLSKDVVIETAGLDFSSPPPYRHTAKPITISAGAWLGTRAIVLGGVTIGEYAIIGAGAVITKDVPPYAVVTGSPSRTRLKESLFASEDAEQRHGNRASD